MIFIAHSFALFIYLLGVGVLLQTFKSAKNNGSIMLIFKLPELYFLIFLIGLSVFEVKTFYILLNAKVIRCEYWQFVYTFVSSTWVILTIFKNRASVNMVEYQKHERL